jgi:hypothetical protein
MAIVRIRREKRDSADDYDALIADVRANENPPAGLIVHAFGQVGEGEWQSIEIWESVEDADRYEREVSDDAIARRQGPSYTPPEPTTYEVHNIIRP